MVAVDAVLKIVEARSIFFSGDVAYTVPHYHGKVLTLNFWWNYVINGPSIEAESSHLARLDLSSP